MGYNVHVGSTNYEPIKRSQSQGLPYGDSERSDFAMLTGMLIPVEQLYSQFKDEGLTPFLYDVPSQVLRNGAVRLMGTMQRFWKGLTEPKKNEPQTVWLNE
jgi:hypothetical protein